MCGIAGLIYFDDRQPTPELLTRMSDTLVHRGPDDWGYHIDGHTGFGHRRLSIIDLSPNGHQPMCNEDGTVWITYNGEVYNYRELNKDLEARGHIIRSRCDTETIIHLYEQYGRDCVHRLRGMFSFAIWDAKNKTLFAAVDRLRIKPFYYSLQGGAFSFASEIKALLAAGLFEPRLNHEAIHHYLSLQAVPVPMTIYEEVFTLPGGFALEVKDDKLSVYKYWDVDFQAAEAESEEYYRRRVRELLWESVSLRLMSDVPLGAFLSGGIDSTVVVAIMSQLNKEPVRTFSIGYDVGGADYDDTYYARLVSQRYKTEHTVRQVSAKDMVEHLPQFLYYLDQPSSDAINSYVVSRLAADEVTVVLSGQGGDELFAGYSSFRLLQKLTQREAVLDRVPALLRNTLAAPFVQMPSVFKAWMPARKLHTFFDNYGSFVKKYAHIRMEISEDQKRRIYSDRFANQLNGTDTLSIYERHLQHVAQNRDPLGKVAYLDVKTHLGDVLLRDMDVMSMAFSLETRVPLIDHKLVEFVSGIPSHMKLRGNAAKYIFIESIRDLLPPEVIQRKKLGFNFPLAIWLRRELRPLIDFVLSREVIEQRGFFKYSEIERLKKEFFTTDVRYRRLWGLVVLEMWLRHVHDRDTQFINRLQAHLNL